MKNKVAYLCDEKACEECRSRAPDCKHTLDVIHAKNFKQIGNGIYKEVEKSKRKFFRRRPI